MNDKNHAEKSETCFSLQEWAATNPKPFNRFDAYKQHIEPLVMALRDACKEHGLPLQYAIVHTQSENGDNAVACGINLTTTNEATAELMAANCMANGEPNVAMAIHQADMVRSMRLQAFFPASGSVH